MESITQSPPELIYHKRKSPLSFTQVVIKKVIRNKRYVSEFIFKYTPVHNKIDVSIHGRSVQDCIDKTEKFLCTKLKLSEITFPE